MLVWGGGASLILCRGWSQACIWSISPPQSVNHCLVWPWCCVLPGCCAAPHLSLLDLTPLPCSAWVFPCFPKTQQCLAWGEEETLAPCLGFRRDLQKDKGGKHLEAVAVGCGRCSRIYFFNLAPCFHSPRVPFPVHSHCCPIRWIPRDSKVNPAEEGRALMFLISC